MISSPGHPLVFEAMEIINQTVQDLRARKKYPNFNLKNKLIGPVLATLLTLSLTGPRVLDKAASRIASTKKTQKDQEKSRLDTSIVYLDDSFFKGPVAEHLQESSWIQGIHKKCLPLIALVILSFVLLITMVVLVTFYASRRR
jgi:hypothetical protein